MRGVCTASFVTQTFKPFSILPRSPTSAQSSVSMSSLTQLSSYLKKARQTLPGPAHIVLGNEAADVDSLACAISLAYIFDSKQGDKPAVPVANLPRSDLRLRRDAELALRLAEIDEKDVLFVDELPGGLEGALSEGNLTLVDHNVLASHQSTVDQKVCGIIDHHKDERKHLDANPRIIVKVGSCASLVAEMLGAEEGNRHVARLLLCAILLDTNNLRAEDKTVPKDIAAVKHLQPLAGWDDAHLESMNKALKKARRDLTGFSVRDMLGRDTKTFVSAKVKIAIASIPMSPNELITLMKGASLAECLGAFADEKKLASMLALLTFDVDGVKQRWLAVAQGPVGDLLQENVYMEEKGEIAMKRMRVKGGDGIWWFQLANARHSRKIVAPVIVKALSSFAANVQI